MDKDKLSLENRKAIHLATISSYIQKEFGKRITGTSEKTTEFFFSNIPKTDEVLEVIRHEMNGRIIKEILESEEYIQLGEEFLTKAVELVANKVEQKLGVKH